MISQAAVGRHCPSKFKGNHENVRDNNTQSHKKKKKKID